jgi:hypothetical protein
MRPVDEYQQVTDGLFFWQGHEPAARTTAPMTMHFRVRFVAAAVAAWCAVCAAQEKPPEQPHRAVIMAVDAASLQNTRPKIDDEVSQLTDAFFFLLGKNEIDKAYAQLTAGTKIAERADDIATLKSKTQQAIQFFGQIQGHELVAVRTVGTHLMAATYLSIGRDFPLRWRFYFYRADKTWRLIDIRVDDRLVDMFDEKPVTLPGASEQPASRQ